MKISRPPENPDTPSKTKHTPGPWWYDEDLSALVAVVGHKVKAIADFGRIDDAEANTRLIAAAPELLEALAETLRCLEWHNRQHGVAMDDVACKKGRAAISKATGNVSKIDKWVRTETPVPQVQMAIELTPTWTEVLPVLLHALEFCDSDTRSKAKVKLHLMASNADAYVKAAERLAQYEKVIANIEAVIEAARYEAA